MSEEEDIIVWKAETDDTKRLRFREVAELPSIPLPLKKGLGVEFNEKNEHILPPHEVDENLPYLKTGEIYGSDGNTAEKLKRGKIAIDARLDLHGMTQSEAFPLLLEFILEAYHAGKRCILVITGKGYKKDGKVGVLRENVPKWLNNPEIRPIILAFSYAKPQDGGEGALYVLLRRKRKKSKQCP